MILYFIELSKDDTIQPPSVWLIYDCRLKLGDLGVRFEFPAGTTDLAHIHINLSSKQEEKYMWQLLSMNVDRFYHLIECDKDQLKWFNKTLSKKSNGFIKIIYK